MAHFIISGIEITERDPEFTYCYQCGGKRKISETVKIELSLRSTGCTEGITDGKILSYIWNELGGDNAEICKQ